jgi:hypothetical protein
MGGHAFLHEGSLYFPVRVVTLGLSIREGMGMHGGRRGVGSWAWPVLRMQAIRARGDGLPPRQRGAEGPPGAQEEGEGLPPIPAAAVASPAAATRMGDAPRTMGDAPRPMDDAPAAPAEI